MKGLNLKQETWYYSVRNGVDTVYFGRNNKMGTKYWSVWYSAKTLYFYKLKKNMLARHIKFISINDKEQIYKRRNVTKYIRTLGKSLSAPTSALILLHLSSMWQCWPWKFSPLLASMWLFSHSFHLSHSLATSPQFPMLVLALPDLEMLEGLKI